MQIPFVTVDVFTERKFGGNPLAVVPDATALTGAQMQAIAGEFNFAETTFVLPPQDPGHTAQVRIFTGEQSLEICKKLMLLHILYCSRNWVSERLCAILLRDAQVLDLIHKN